MTRSRSPNSVLDANIIRSPHRWFGYVAFCEEGIYRVVDFDDEPYIMELVGQPCEVVDGRIVECESQCQQCLQASDVIMFITPDIEAQFALKYAKSLDQDCSDALLSWLFDEEVEDSNEVQPETRPPTPQRSSHRPQEPEE